jgi:uncharacterized protein (TIGR00369 family)
VRPEPQLRSPSWDALHEALRSGTLPPPRTVGVKMKLHHRSVAPGRWSGEVVFERGATNSLGILHGGFLASLLDIAMGYASLTQLESGETQRTLEMKINFLEGIPPENVQIEGEVLRRGKRTAYCEGSIRSVGGELIARASATFSIRGRR